MRGRPQQDSELQVLAASTAGGGAVLTGPYQVLLPAQVACPAACAFAAAAVHMDGCMWAATTERDVACYADRRTVRAETQLFNWWPCCPHTTCSNKDRRAQAFSSKHEEVGLLGSL